MYNDIHHKWLNVCLRDPSENTELAFGHCLRGRWILHVHERQQPETVITPCRGMTTGKCARGLVSAGGCILIHPAIMLADKYFNGILITESECCCLNVWSFMAIDSGAFRKMSLTPKPRTGFNIIWKPTAGRNGVFCFFFTAIISPQQHFTTNEKFRQLQTTEYWWQLFVLQLNDRFLFWFSFYE